MFCTGTAQRDFCVRLPTPHVGTHTCVCTGVRGEERRGEERRGEEKRGEERRGEERRGEERRGEEKRGGFLNFYIFKLSEVLATITWHSFWSRYVQSHLRSSFQNYNTGTTGVTTWYKTKQKQTQTHTHTPPGWHKCIQTTRNTLCKLT